MFEDFVITEVATPADTTPPAAPTNLSTNPGDAQVTLTWDDNSEPDLAGYNVYRSTSTPINLNSAPLNGSLLTTSDYVDSPATNGEIYYYAVIAVDDSGNQSAAATASAQPDTGTPLSFTLPVQINFQSESAPVPSGYTKDFGQSFANVRGFGWRNTSGDPLSLVGNGRDRGGSSDQRLDTLLHMQANDISGNFNGFSTEGVWEIALPNGDYSVEVAVGDANVGNDPTTHQINVEGVVVVVAYTTKSASVEASGDARWTTGTAAVTVSDGVLRIDANGGTNTKINYIIISEVTEETPTPETPTATEETETPTVETPTPETPTATEETETPTAETPTATEETVTPTPETPTVPADEAPVAPTGLSAAAGDGQVELTWNANGESDLASYTLYRATDATGPFTAVGNVPASITTAVDTDNGAGLANGTTYYYKLTATDNGGNESDFSNGVSATPTAATPTAATPTVTSTATVTPTETATAQTPTTTVTPAPGLFTAKINFQPEGPITNPVPVPNGYTKDTGAAYDDGRGFGWITQASIGTGNPVPLDISPNARDRNQNNDQRLDTLLHMQFPPIAPNNTAVKTPAAWEIAVPNGSYAVTVAVGDPQNGTDPENHVINVEGVNAIAGFPKSSAANGANERHTTATVTVTVTDGKLTIDAIGGENTKINYVDIVETTATAETPTVETPTATTPTATTPTATTPTATTPTATTPAVTATPVPGPAFDAKVNFQNPDAVVPTGYLRDFGQPYGARSDANQGSGLTYGWIAPSTGAPLDITLNGRDRGFSGTPAQSGLDQQLDTLMHMQANDVAVFNGTAAEGVWEIAVPNGTYEVTVSVGDPNKDGKPEDTPSHTINVESINAINGFYFEAPNGSVTRHFSTTVTVQVGDGKLTVDANGGFNTKINYIDIANVGPVTNAPPVANDDTANVIEGGSVAINVLANDTDAQGNNTIDAASVAIVDRPANGSVVVDTSTGIVTYTHDGSATTTDSFTYTVSDLAGDVSDVATVAITIFPAGSSAGTITIIKDALPNSTQTFTFDGTNSLGSFTLTDNGNTQADGPPTKINFQPEGPITNPVPVPTGFSKDTGSAYSDARGFGWITQDSVGSGNAVPLDISPNARDRNVSGVPQERDTFMHMQYPPAASNNTAVKTPAAWEIAVANGLYQVTVVLGEPNPVAGDPENYDFTIENTKVVDDFVPTGAAGADSQYITAVATVNVQDGKLTLHAIGGTNTKIAYVEIQPVSSVGGTNTVTFDELAPGQYTITEQQVSGWSLDSVACVGGNTTKTEDGVVITLGSNDVVECTFTNSDDSVELRPYVTGTRPADGATAIACSVNIATDVELSNVGQGVDANTLNSQTVLLYRTNDNDPVPALTIGTTGGGDAIIFNPAVALQPNTSYTYKVTDGVKDLSGAAFLPFSMSFATGVCDEDTGSVLSGVEFTKQTFFDDGTGKTRFSSLAMGPDGKLYASTIDGRIYR